MDTYYWTSAMSTRLTRRRAVLGAGAGAVGTALLAACGGKSGGGADGQKSDLLAAKADTSARAVRGGRMHSYLQADLVGLNPTTVPSLTTLNFLTNLYSNLTKFGLGIGAPPGPEGIKGDAAESWEFSPDGQQVTFKLRPRHVFDPRPPTNGRAATSADVKYSWDRFASSSPYGPETLNSRTPTGPIVSLQTPDAQTVVVKMAFPYTPVVQMLGFHSYLYLIPTEADGQYNPSSEARGSGPFFLKEWKPSVSVELERNANWYEKGQPFLDGVLYSILPENATGLAQFESKALWDWAVGQQDILRVKRDHPEMMMYNVSPRDGTPLDHYFQFSQQPNSPYRDVRVRRAVSMLIDRDAWIDTMYQSDTFESQGIPVDSLWHSHIPIQGPNWIDPKGNGLGEGAQYFRHDPDNAVKLIKAAGFDKVKSTFFWTSLAGPYAKRSELVLGMLTDGGKFDLSAKALDHNTEWRATCQQSGGLGFDGICYATSGGYNEETHLISVYTPDGKYRISSSPVPKFSDLVTNIRRELDEKKRSEMIKDIQKQLAVEMPMIPLPGIASSFTLRWPWLMNHGVFSTGSPTSKAPANYWYDSSKQK